MQQPPQQHTASSSTAPSHPAFHAFHAFHASHDVHTGHMGHTGHTGSHHVIQCANCGRHGHVYRVCNLPISSFGVICYRIRSDGPQYLMVQRKDSLCYVEFVRGKYSLQNRGYILKLLSNMTAQERERLRSLEFDTLWFEFWQSDHTRTYMKEYEQSRARFNMLRHGYWLRPPRPGRGATIDAPRQPIMHFSLAGALDATAPAYNETEFGFPKGRRNINETDLKCACREFREETGYDLASIALVPHLEPYEEVFIGSNRVQYRHVYYIARLVEDEAMAATAMPGPGDPEALPTLPPRLSAMQQREVSSVGWYDAPGVLQRIRPENAERREMFRQVHKWVLRTTDVQASRGSESGASSASP